MKTRKKKRNQDEPFVGTLSLKWFQFTVVGGLEISMNSIHFLQNFSKEDNLDKTGENLEEKISDARSDKEEGTDKVRLFY